MASATTSVTVDEAARILVWVTNRGDGAGTYETELVVDGTVVSSASVDVEPGQSRTLALDHRFDAPGEYAVAVGEPPLRTLTVQVAPVTTTPTVTADLATGEGPIAVVEATVPTDWVAEGYNASVRATVVNTANRTANRTLTVTVDGQTVATRPVTLGPNERDTVTIEFPAVGGAVAVDGVEAGRIEVGASTASPQTATPDEPAGAEVLFGIGRVVVYGGFAVLVGVFLVGATLQLSRRPS